MKIVTFKKIHYIVSCACDGPSTRKQSMMFKFHGVIAIASPEESHARDGEDGHCGGEGHTHPAYHQQ